MKKKHNRRKQADRRVALEISHADLALAIVSGEGEQRTVTGHRTKWLTQAASLTKEEAIQELSEVLSKLVAKEKLVGAKVNIALSSDFCVTRVIAGENDRVAAELRSLNARSNQYLLLGAGQKAVAESTQTIDAKQSQAWLTVTNSGILENIVTAVADAGLQVDLIEHDMVAVCRAVGRMGGDQDAPVIVAKMNERGVVLGVSYNGQLLFDYRPGGVDSKDRVGEIVQRHLERIQRYCNRQFRFATGEISSVYVCGSESEVEAIRTQLENSASGLSALAINPIDVSSGWEFDAGFLADGHFLAALGSALVDEERLGAAACGHGMPNLMDYVLSANRPPMWPAVFRAAWPVAATILVGLGIYSAALMQHRKASALESKVAQYDRQMDELKTLKLQTASATSKLQYLKRIDEQILNPAWNDLIGWIGQSMPPGVWLDSLRVDQNGMVSITGPGASEDLVYDFVRYLKEIPVLDHVNLEGQQPMQLPQGVVIKFDIKCQFNDQANLAERTASND